MAGMADPATVTDADRAWVRHLNAGMKAYRAFTGDTPYSLAANPPPTTSNPRQLSDCFGANPHRSAAARNVLSRDHNAEPGVSAADASRFTST